jgi:hypothetical protein
LPFAVISVPLTFISLPLALVTLTFALIVLFAKLTDLLADFIHFRSDVSHELRLLRRDFSPLRSPLVDQGLKGRLPYEGRKRLIEEVVKQRCHRLSLAVLADADVDEPITCLEDVDQ